MFVAISILISLGILGFMFYFAKQRESTLQRKYELLVNLRQVLYLCRQHRSATHHALMFGEHRDAELNHLHDVMHDKTNHLIAIAHFDNKPMYRVLQLKLNALIKEWDQRTIARNQMMHGKAIRHCMFLMDEVMLAWLVEVNREDLSDEYHLNWQQIIDTMDALTQLRICVEDMDSHEGHSRVQHYSEIVRRKLNQLSLIHPLSISSPACVEAMQVLDDIHTGQNHQISREEMYQVTGDISLTVAHVYDHMLSEMTESLYIPLPKLLIA